MERTSVVASLALILGALLACKGTSENASPAPSAVTTSVATAAKSTDVTFVKGVPKPGTKIDQSMKTAFKFTFAGKVYREEEENVSNIDVQAADEFRVTKAAIDVKTLVETKQEGTDGEKRSVNPLAGSRYVLSRTDDGKLSALSSAGTPVPASVLVQLKEHFGDVVEKDKTREFLPARPVKIGEKLIPSSDSVLKLLGQKDDGSTTIDGVEFILNSASGDKATFNVSMTFTTKIDAQMRLRAKLDGTVDIRPKDAEVTGVSLKGPLTILDAGGNEKGNGDMTFSGTASTN
jgi:hypothetical protein